MVTAAPTGYNDFVEDSASPCTISSQTATGAVSMKPTPDSDSNLLQEQTATAELTPNSCGCSNCSSASHNQLRKPHGQSPNSWLDFRCSSPPEQHVSTIKSTDQVPTINSSKTERGLSPSSWEVGHAAWTLYMMSSPAGTVSLSPARGQITSWTCQNMKDTDETEDFDSEATTDELEQALREGDIYEEAWPSCGIRQRIDQLRQLETGSFWRHHKLVPTDRSGTSFETDEEQKRRDSQIDQHVLAKDFMKKAEVHKKPPEDIEKAIKDAETAAGIPGGFPEDKQEAQRCLDSAIRRIVKKGVERNSFWSQAEAYKKQVERMGDVTPLWGGLESLGTGRKSARIQRQTEEASMIAIQHRGRIHPQHPRRNAVTAAKSSNIKNQGAEEIEQTAPPTPATEQLCSAGFTQDDQRREGTTVVMTTSEGNTPAQIESTLIKRHRPRAVNELESTFNPGVCEPHYDERGGRVRRKPRDVFRD